MRFKTNLLVSGFLILLMAHPVFAKNIAVMPFENITKDAEKNWIGAGFAETLTTKLCKVKEVNLLEREQLSKILDEIKFQKSGLVDESTAVQTGKMYGVEVMVFGSYQVVGDTLRVSARFVNVETRKVIDTAETTGNIADIFKLQDNIAFSLMDSLKIVLAEKEKQEVKVNPTENLTAYQWFSKGYDADNLKLYDKAIEYYQKAININPKYVEAYNNMGIIYSKQGNDNKALEMYEKAISINPEHASTYANMGAAYNNKGDFDKAIKLYGKAININPSDAESYYNMGLAYDHKGNYDKAIGLYEKAISFNPKDDTAYNNMGVIYGEQVNYDKAIEMFKKAININPEDADTYNNMGKTYGQKGDYEMSISCHKKAARLGDKKAQKYLKDKGIDW